MQVTAVDLLQYRIRIKTTQLMTDAIIHVEQDHQAFIGFRIGISVAQQPALINRGIRHMSIFCQDISAHPLHRWLILVPAKMVMALSLVRASDIDSLVITPSGMP